MGAGEVREWSECFMATEVSSPTGYFSVDFVSLELNHRSFAGKFSELPRVGISRRGSSDNLFKLLSELASQTTMKCALSGKVISTKRNS